MKIDSLENSLINQISSSLRYKHARNWIILVNQNYRPHTTTTQRNHLPIFIS